MRQLLLIASLSGLLITAKSQNFQFIENKGQWNNNVLYKADIAGGSIFFEKNGYRVLLNNSAELKAIEEQLAGHSQQGKKENVKYILHSHAYEMEFAGGASNKYITASAEEPSFNNYFIGTNTANWSTHCKIYNAVSYKNIYPGIDVNYYTQNTHLKYDFIVHPGGNPSNIKLLFKGVDALACKNEDLIIKTSLGDVSELKPLSYQQAGNIKKTISNKYKLTGNEVSFTVGNYDKSADLIIDPTLIFSSYVGSTADDWGYCSAYDKQGNFFAGSIAFDHGFPVSLGAFQTTYQGGDGSEGSGIACDIAIFKFNATGTERLYATYLGGSGDEQPQAMIADKDNNLIITGRTTSSNFPVTTEKYGHGGSFDIYIAKLNNDGTALLASRKFGGAGADGVNISPKYVSEGILSIRRNYNDDSRNDITLDNDGNIYFAGCTRSADFPFTANAFKKTLTGSQDGVFIKASADLTNIYTSSYVGGNGDDGIFSIAISKTTGNIYLGGSTTSTNLAFNAADDPNGILKSSFSGGECDGFISVLNSNADALIRTVYIGTQGNDMLYELATDAAGSVYITGTTTQAFPVINAEWKQAQGKQFITKLNAELTHVQYSTNFGKGNNYPDITPVAFAVDKCENVYMNGWGGSANHAFYPLQNTTGLSVTADALSANTDGNDFYIFVLKANATAQLFGSFFGTNSGEAFGDHIDGASSRFDENGNLYMATCANCNKIGIFPTTTGVWSPGNPATEGAKCNYAGVKIKFDFNNCILPLKILSFTGSYNNNAVVLNWTTANEINTDYFIVEYSSDAVQFKELAHVPAHNNANVNSYSYNEKVLSSGKRFYRLKIVDKDGNYFYSGTFSLTALINGTIFISPNPSDKNITVYLNNVAHNTELVILNINGSVVHKQIVPANTAQVNLNIESLAKGYYKIELTDNKKIIRTSTLIKY